MSAWSSGDAVLPLDPKAPGSVTKAALERLRPDAIVDDVGTTQLETGRPVPEGTAAVIQSSGSSGVPKGAVLSHSALRASARMTHERLGAEAGHRWVCILPLHHIAGFSMLTRAAELGTDVSFPARDGSGSIGDIAGTFISVVPTQLLRFMNEGRDLSGFRAVLVGGAAVDGQLIERSAGAGINVVRTYGMTETCGGVVYDGVPLDGVKVRVGGEELPGAPSAPVGAIEIFSPSLMTAYRFGNPTGEWFDTADLGRITAGKLEVIGRSDDVINTGGEKVMPRQVEDVLKRHPGVKDALVLGAPDPRWGEMVVAVLVADSAMEAELAESVRRNLERHAVPKRFVFLDSIPRTSLGKPDLARLKEEAPGIF
jgi:O-succinylbenzoic acid--CoA ligase